jgi:hypothetical protein
VRWSGEAMALVVKAIECYEKPAEEGPIQSVWPETLDRGL